MKEAKSKSLDIQSRPDRDRRVRQADRIARVLKVFSLIQSGRNYDVKAIASELNCAERTVARDLEVLTYAGVPWYFDKEHRSYRVPKDYRFPISVAPNSATIPFMNQSPKRLSRYVDYFRVDDPMSKNEIHFVARWLHKNHNFSDLEPKSATRWNHTWKLPEVALANFYTVFMHAFNGETAAFFDLVIDYRVVVIGVPWKSESEFRGRDQTICNWIRQHKIGSTIDITEQIKKYRSLHP